MVEDIFGIVGTTLAGSFHVEEVIAEGGFGLVYRAEHVAFRAPVALKCLKIPGTISPTQSENFVENFREEAEILFHLSAQIPEVVRPLHADAMTLPDGTFVPFLAMEWVDGKPLDSIVILREEDGLRPLELRKVVRMLSPIAVALSKAHRFQVPGGAVVSVTHCDLKPENILITEPDSPVRAKILDFGIAKAQDTMRQHVGRITESEASRPFTPSYGAPEQWVPKRYGQTGPWTDVWGLALTMVECLTGQPPIDGDMHSMMGTALDKSRRPSPKAEGADVSAASEQVFRRALAVDPRERYQDIETFWTEVEEAAGLPSTFERLRRLSRLDEDLEPGRASSPEVSEFDLELEMEPSGGGELDLPVDDLYEPTSARQVAGPSPLAGTEAELELEPSSLRPGKGSGSIDAPGSLDGLAVDSSPPGEIEASFDLDLGRSEPPAEPAPPVSEGPLAGRSASPLTRTGNRPAVASKAHDPADESEEATVVDALKVPLMVVAVGVVMTAFDMGLSRSVGEPLGIGPIRLRWIAAVFFLVGLVMAFWNLFGERD